MKAVIQRVKEARVSVEGRVRGACGEGLLILLGVAEGDTLEDATLLVKKIAALRIFCDESGRMNRSVKDVEGEALVVSNFTLMANYKKGNRPDYMSAAAPDVANALYESFCDMLEAELSHVGRGVFGAHMEIDMCADGPVTIVMESEVLKKRNGQGERV